MKKIFLLAIGFMLLSGCSNDYYDSLNVDPKNPSEVPGYFLVTNATTSLFDQMTSTNVNLNVFKLFAQYYTETQYTDEANYDITNRSIPDNHWSELYRDVLNDLESAKVLIENDPLLLTNERKNQLAIVDMLQVYTWQILVDTFGNIPYSEALKGAEGATPVYDDAATIYSDLIVRITNDINAIDINSEGFGSNDIIYHGDVSAWKKFAASLKLRLGVQILDVNPTLATTTIKDAVSSGVFTSNSDNFVLQYLSTDPYQNPIAVDLGARNDFVAANTIVDFMNAKSDPRRYSYFDENLGADTFLGGTYAAGSAFSSYSHLGSLMYAYETPGDLLDYSEVEFLMAEAMAKGVTGIGGTVETHYNAGILASMDYWGVSSIDAALYMSRTDVVFATASGSNLEKIALQFYIAMFNRGFEGWNVWRRLNAPNLASPAPLSGLPIPLRYTYPVDEQTINQTNWQAASTAIGGDAQQTPIFWDVND